MSDLVAFLKARLLEDEQAARDAATRVGEWRLAEQSPRPWGDDEQPAQILAAGKSIMTFSVEYGGPLTDDHVLRWDPARVLAEIEAKRRVLARHRRMGDIYPHALVPDACEGCGLDEGEWNVSDINDCPELFDLVSPYADHPDFDESWRT